MNRRAILEQQLPQVLHHTEFSSLGARYEGKVRDSYTRDGVRWLITTDRLSCFDRVVTTIPFKGQVLTSLAAFWFQRSQDIVANHLIDLPDPNVMVVQECEVLPIEVVVRGFLAGSALRDYQVGKSVSGVTLPPGLQPYQKLEAPTLTPSTKAPSGSHDEPISEHEILRREILPAKLWDEVREAALALFALGQSVAEKQGLLLADTKYEFGVRDGKLLLVDEIHTLDSSRYWVAESYEARLAAGEAPQMLDKEPTRQWLLERGFKGDGPIPEFTAAHRVDIAEHYLSSAERITGTKMLLQVGPVAERIARAIAARAA